MWMVHWGMRLLRPVVALLMCMAVPAAGLSALHHESTEVHVVCAEHNHVVHADAAGDLEGLNAGASDHEECAFDQMTPEGALEGPRPAIAELRPAAAVFVEVDAQEAGWASLAVLDYAPKASPPLS